MALTIGLPIFNPIATTRQADRKFGIVALFLWCGIFMSPRVSSADIFSLAARFRFEDFLGPVVLLYVFNNRRQFCDIIGTFLWRLMFLWVTYIVVFTLLNQLTSNIPPVVGVLFAGKEVEYLLFFSFMVVFAARNPKCAVFTMLAALIPLYAKVLWQCATGQFTGYYGLIGLPWESSVSQSGAVLAILFACAVATLFNKETLTRRIVYGDTLLYLIAVTTFGALIMTLSRTAIIAGAVTLMVLAATKIFRLKINLRPVLVFTFIAAAATWAACWQLNLYDAIAGRFSYIESAAADRLDKCLMIVGYQLNDALALLAGWGLGSVNFIIDDFRDFGLILLVDNQFVRRFFELGIVGSACWVTLWFGIAARIVATSRDKSHHQLIKDSVLAVVTVMCVLSLGMEAFQLIRPASTFHALMGLLMGLAASQNTDFSVTNSSMKNDTRPNHNRNF